MAGEAVRNVFTARSRSLALWAAVAVLSAAVTWSELDTVDKLLGFQAEYFRKGGTVVVASSPSGLPSEVCEGLSSQDWVTHSGGWRWVDTFETTNTPGNSFSGVDVTVGLVPILAVGVFPGEARQPGVILGTASAAELGRSAGMWLDLGAEGMVLVRAVIDTKDRSGIAERAVMAVSPATGEVDECWVEAKPGTEDVASDYLMATFAGAEELGTYRLAELNSFSRDVKADLADRPQSRIWMLVGVVVALLFWTTTFLRRSHIGLYRAVGTTIPTLWVLGSLETLLVVVPATATGVLWAAAYFEAFRAETLVAGQVQVACRNVAAGMLLALVLSPVVWAMTGRGHLLSQLKDR